MDSSSDITKVFERLTKIDINKMSWTDQMRYALNVAKFAEDMKPLVDKYANDDKKKRDMFDELLQYFKDADKEPHDTEIKPEDDGEVTNAED